MNANYILLYVSDPVHSRDFYRRLLGLEPVEDSPTFVLFVLPSGVKLGLWAAATVQPAASSPGGSEIGLSVETRQDIDRMAADWRAQGLDVIQEPQDMDFGRTATALDPDGHRLRILHLAA